MEHSYKQNQYKQNQYKQNFGHLNQKEKKETEENDG